MFELPEVETIRRDLERDVVGKKVKSVEAHSMKTIGRYNNRKAFTSQLDNVKITSVERIGLRLVLGLDSGEVLVISLGSTASLRRAANRDKDLDDTEIVITFTQHGQLRFIDPEGTGEMFVVAAAELPEALPEVATYGLDPVAEPISWTVFARHLLDNSDKVKNMLTDPTFVVGIGNIYADEILFEAGLRHDREANTLSSQEIRRFHRALVGKLHDAMKYRGTDLPERPFVDTAGEPGGFGEHLEVYGKNGQLSSRSRLPIKRVKFGGVWTYYCETQV